MPNENLLLQSIASAVGLRKLSARTWQNLTATLDRELLGRMARAACAGTDESERMRQGLANAILCASGKLEDSLAQAGIECTPRLLMRAAKHDAALLDALRALAGGTGSAEVIESVRTALKSVRRVRNSAKSAGSSGTSGASPAAALRFTPLSQHPPLPVLQCASAEDNTSLDLSEGEALLLYGVLRGALVSVEIGDNHGTRRLRAKTAGGRTQVQWLKGRRVAATLLFASAPQALATVVAESLLKTVPSQDQLGRLDAAAVGLAAARQGDYRGT